MNDIDDNHYKENNQDKINNADDKSNDFAFYQHYNDETNYQYCFHLNMLHFKPRSFDTILFTVF